MNWNRKYRPYQLAGLHLGSVREQLLSFLNQGKIPQALLFAGPKGTGKTSASRIIGAILNSPENAAVVEAVYIKNQPQKGAQLKDITQLDNLGKKILQGNSFVVQEMDAASNRGIDDIRALKDRIMLPPQEGVISVFILDEAHMLTTEAFNALLKILEEPPAHVVFILATTELHKIPGTIASRSQLVTFRKATTTEIAEALATVFQSEKIKHEAEALEMIALLADGSFRDAIKLSEAAAGEGTITKQAVEKFAAAVLENEVRSLIAAVVKKEAKTIITIFAELRKRAVDADYFYKQVMRSLHQSLEIHHGLVEGKAVADEPVARFLLNELLDETFALPSPIPHLPLELKLLAIIERAKKNGPAKKPTKNQPTGKKKDPTQPIKVMAEAITIPQQTDKIEHLQHHQNQGDGTLLLNQWQEFVTRVAQVNSTFAALLQSAKPLSGDPGNIAVGVYYQFHQEQLSSNKFLEMIEPIINDICGGQVTISIVMADTPRHAQLTEPQLKEKDKIPELAQVASEALM